MCSKLALGTVQFGMDYGISNTHGQTRKDEVSKILKVAESSGIQLLDTAPAYGTSEELLGMTIDTDSHFLLVTKTPVFAGKPITGFEAEEVRSVFQRSMQRLKTSSVYGLLCHHGVDLLSPRGVSIYEQMLNLKNEGLVSKIGFSSYEKIEIEEVLSRFTFDLIQVPVNVFDQRLLKDGYLQKLKSFGIEIHARSVFLQGLLLMDPAELPQYFNPIKLHLSRYRKRIADVGVSGVEVALGFALSLDEIDHVVCGVCNHTELLELCRVNALGDIRWLMEFALDASEFVNPALWNQAQKAAS